MKALPHLILSAILAVVAFGKGVDDPRISPDKRFETYREPASNNGIGTRMHIRERTDHSKDWVLLENARWIDTKWSPDGSFLTVVDHPDGHVADVYIYRLKKRISLADKEPQNQFHILCDKAGKIATQLVFTNSVLCLCYHTPDLWTHDVKWDVVAWDEAHARVTLSKEITEPEENTRTTLRLRVTIPDTPIQVEGTEKAEQAGADQPATKPADKPPVKDQPSTPTSKDAPR